LKLVSIATENVFAGNLARNARDFFVYFVMTFFQINVEVFNVFVLISKLICLFKKFPICFLDKNLDVY
jgi:hypothetical protein